MFFKIFLFLTGIMQTAFSLTFMLIYLNLLNMGYDLLGYLKFVFSRFECISFLFGIILIIVSLRKKGDKNDIHI